MLERTITSPSHSTSANWRRAYGPRCDVRRRPTKAPRHFEGSLLDHRAHACEVFGADLVHRAGDAHGGFEFARNAQHRGAHAAYSELFLFVVHGIAGAAR